MTRAMLPAQRSVHYFEVLLHGNEKYNIAIGVADKHFKLIENFVGYPSMKKSTPSWGYSNNGLIRNGTDSSGAPVTSETYTVNDTIGVLVDFKDQSISFYKNGKLAKDGHKVPMKQLNVGSKYWPVVTLYSKQDKVSIPDHYKISFWNDLLPLLLEERKPMPDVTYDSEDDQGDRDDHVNYRKAISTKMRKTSEKRASAKSPKLRVADPEVDGMSIDEVVVKTQSSSSRSFCTVM